MSSSSSHIHQRRTTASSLNEESNKDKDKDAIDSTPGGRGVGVRLGPDIGSAAQHRGTGRKLRSGSDIYAIAETLVFTIFPFLIFLLTLVGLVVLFGLPSLVAGPTSSTASVLQLSERQAEGFAPVLRYDLDGDNALSHEEFGEFVLAQMIHAHKDPGTSFIGRWLLRIHVTTRFLQLDVDGDNRLSMSEIEANKNPDLPDLKAAHFSRWVAGVLWGLQPPQLDVNFLK
eukprot:PhM_4_TR12382/c0_g1_i1/m.61646